MRGAEVSGGPGRALDGEPRIFAGLGGRFHEFNDDVIQLADDLRAVAIFSSHGGIDF